jgi:hypothetical protein
MIYKTVTEEDGSKNATTFRPADLHDDQNGADTPGGGVAISWAARCAARPSAGGSHQRSYTEERTRAFWRQWSWQPRRSTSPRASWSRSSSTSPVGYGANRVHAYRCLTATAVCLIVKGTFGLAAGDARRARSDHRRTAPRPPPTGLRHAAASHQGRQRHRPAAYPGRFLRHASIEKTPSTSTLWTTPVTGLRRENKEPAPPPIRCAARAVQKTGVLRPPGISAHEISSGSPVNGRTTKCSPSDLFVADFVA